MKIRLNIFCIALASVLLSSCNAWLKEEPKSQFTFDNYFVDYTTLDAGVVGIYQTVSNLFYVDTNTPMFMTLLGTDECMSKGYQNNLRAYLDRYTYSVTEGSIAEYWNRHYKIIKNANIVIDAAHKIASLTTQQRNTCEGEARFLRAFAYFRLVQAFGAIPIITEPIVSDFDYSLPRSGVKDVYNLIIDDLNFASADSVLTKAKTGNGRANHWAAKALLGKVLLTLASTKETGKVSGYEEVVKTPVQLYSDAYDVLSDVVKNSGADLLPVYGDVFKIANKNINKESMWEIQYSSVIPYGSQWSKEFGMIASAPAASNPSGFVPWQVNAMVGSAFLVYFPGFRKYYQTVTDKTGAVRQDLRRSWNLADSIVNFVNAAPKSTTVIFGTVNTPDSYNSTTLGRCGVTKYRWGNSYKENITFSYSNCPTNVIVMRYADVLLMLAEADYKKNGGNISAAGLEALNRVRRRAFGYDSNTASSADRTAADITIDEILKERARELCFEFQRWFDLARTGKFEAFLSERNTKTVDLGKTYFSSDRHYLFPIPQSQIDLSTNKQGFYQNPNY
jgi:hypothetical protein